MGVSKRGKSTNNQKKEESRVRELFQPRRGDKECRI